jgi:general secretion pathway protein D
MRNPVFFWSPWYPARAVAALSFVAAVIPVAPAFAQVTPKPRVLGAQDHVTLNFPSVEVDAAARVMSSILARPILVDPRAKGSITLYTDQPVSRAQAYLIFGSAIRGLGFAMVESGGLLKLVPEADAKLQSSSVVSAGPGRDEEVVTQVITLMHESANNLVPILRPLISPNNTINASAGNNTLVITDYAGNLKRLAAVVSALDRPSATDVEVIRLQHTVAADMAPIVQKLSDTPGAAGAAQGAGPAGSSGSGALSITPESHLNALLVRAPNAARLAGVRALISRLDQPGGSGSNIHVVYLKFVDATRLAQVLRAAWSADSRTPGTSGASAATTLASTSGSTTGGLQASSGNGNASVQASAPVVAVGQPSLGGFIQADPSSNSLIVTAPEPLYRELRAVIEELDNRRAQLYVESVVVEVDASKALDVGLQWKSIFNITKDTELSLGAVAKAIQSTAGTNILSTANLVTLDNEEAKIVVGQNVPFVTGQYTNTGTSTSSPFQTIERKDVGITLRIRPQIGANGTIRMIIFQESSSVSSTAAAGTGNAGPTTNKRSIESTVVVDDGKIIVLGGLIEDSYTVDRTQIPLLGELPLIGGIFRNMSRSRSRTNLVVFLRPMIMRDDAQASARSLDRYDYIRANQQAVQPNRAEMLPGEAGPLLPANPATVPLEPAPPPPAVP